jgi:hypothetical protein
MSDYVHMRISILPTVDLCIHRPPCYLNGATGQVKQDSKDYGG